MSEDLILYSLILSSITTLPFAFKIFVFLLYSKVSAVIIVCPLFVSAVPLFKPLKKFPSFVISTSVTLKLNGSLAYKCAKFNKNKNIMYEIKLLFFIYLH